MKVYDCFTFYNEFELLELRLKSLWDAVDCFVIVEADKTHTNKPKPFYFWERQDDFKEFFPKIRHLPVEMTVPYRGAGDWSIENAQRDAIIYGLEDAADDDLIMISDLDEIPAPDIIDRLNAHEEDLFFYAVVEPPSANERMVYPAKLLVPALEHLEKNFVVLEQNVHYYYFDWIGRENWFGTVLTKRKNLTTPQMLREIKNLLPRILNGGHHFSYMGGTERVIEKMTSIVDGNSYVVQLGETLTDKRRVEKAMATGANVYNPSVNPEAHFVPYDVKNIKWPCMNEFLKKYPYFLREPEKYFAN